VSLGFTGSWFENLRSPVLYAASLGDGCSVAGAFLGLVWFFSWGLVVNLGPF